MNNSKTPKIVVGVGLAAVYASGLAYFILRGAHDNVIAQSAPTVSTPQIAADAVSPTGIAPASADLSTSAVEQPAAMVAAAAPVVAAAQKAQEPAATRGGSDVRSRSKEQALASVKTAPPAETTELAKASPTNEGASVVGEPANAAGDSSSSTQATSTPSGNDSQITADVKSEIAAVAPAGAIDVTTRDGVVELSGSVPSEEVINKALLAARNVADVRDVDVSALTISN
jgi:osmotically-inducible protein OsmY